MAGWLLNNLLEGAGTPSPSSCFIPRKSRPSIKAGYARNAGESEWPGYWKNLQIGYAPCLGPTGLETVPEVLGKYPGTISGSMTSVDWLSGPYGWALDHDGSDDFYYNNSFAADYYSGTLLFTAKHSASSPSTMYASIVSSSDGSKTPSFQTGYDAASATQIEFWIRDSAAVTYELKLWDYDQDWHVYAVTLDDDIVTTYCDGQYMAQQAVNANTHFNFELIRIGENRGVSAWFKGLIGQFLCWDRCFSVPEIRHISRDPLALFRLKPRVLHSPLAVAAFEPFYAHPFTRLPL